MISKNMLFAWLILLLASCKDDIKKKEVIVGMDEEVDSIANLKPVAKPDSGFADSITRRNVLEHDTALRNRKRMNPGLTTIPVFKGAVSLKEFIVEIKQLVAVNNKKEIAERIKYPLNNTIKTKGDFYLSYDKLFTAAVKSALASTDVDKLPRNQRTVMIANGKILIARQGNDFKIIRINN